MMKETDCINERKKPVLKRKSALLFSLLLGLFFLAMIWFLGHDRSLPTSSDGGGGTDPQTKVQNDVGGDVKYLYVSVYMPDSEFDMLKQLTGEYGHTHPDVTINLQNLSEFTAYSELKEASRLGEAPDIMLLDNTWVNEFAALGFLEQADSFFTTAVQAEQFPQPMAQLKWNGYVWGVPFEVDPYILAWNKKRFNEAGFKKPPGNAEELLAMQQAMSEPGKGKHGFYMEPRDPYAFLSAVWSLGGSWNSDRPAGKEGMLAIDDGQFLPVLQAFLYPGRKGAASAVGEPLAEAFPGGEQWDAWAKLNEGGIAMMLTTVSEYNRHAGSGIAMAAMPSNVAKKNKDARSGAWLKGKSFAVSSRSAYSQEAFQWIAAMTEDKNQVKLAEAGGEMPAIRPVYGNSFELHITPDPIERTVQQGRVLKPGVYFPERIRVMSEGLSRLFDGSESLEQFVKALALRWYTPQEK